MSCLTIFHIYLNTECVFATVYNKNGENIKLSVKCVFECVGKHNGKDIISDPRKNFSRYHETPMTVSTDICHEFDDESSVDIEDITIRPVYTPGHTVDSTSYIVGTSLFTGDAYIPGVKVVTKLKGANKEQAENSMVHLKNIQKDNNYSLYPGHGDIIISNTDIQI